MMTQEILQSLFDRSVNHVLDQGKPSAIVEGFNRATCLYHHPEGLKCAAAIFINNYDPAMEGGTWTKLCQDFSGSLDPDSVDHPIFVTRLQYAHDEAARDATMTSTDSSFLPRYARRVRQVGVEYGLKIPPRLADLVPTGTESGESHE